MKTHSCQGFILLLAVLAVISCSAKGTEGIYGTWITPDGEGYYKYVFNADGSGFYENRDGSNKMEGRFVIDRKWIDSEGNTWYMQKLRWSMAPYDAQRATVWYALNKVDPTGKKRESDASPIAYPKDMSSPVHQGFHRMYVRQ